MKKSEYIDTYKVRICVAMGHRDERELAILAEMAARLVEDAGVQWDPEEVDLERLMVSSLGVLCAKVGGVVRSLTEKENREAAARWNFFGRLDLDGHDRGDFSLALLRKLIREEREKLK